LRNASFPIRCESRVNGIRRGTDVMIASKAAMVADFSDGGKGLPALPRQTGGGVMGIHIR
jgi:S-adenosylhomocysteine hydrolase